MQAANARTGTKRPLPFTTGGPRVQPDVQPSTTAAGGGGGDEPFIEVKTKRRRKGQQRQRVRKQPTAESRLHMEEVIETVGSQGPSQDSNGDMSFSDDSSVEGISGINLENELNRLKKLVHTLQHQVDFLMSYVGISQPQPANNNPSSATVNTTETTSNVNSYAAAAAAGVKKLQGPVRNAILTAVYSDLHARESMQNNVVVYGLAPKSDSSDTDVFVDFCLVQLGYKPDVARVTRLGKPMENKVQPLLVVCNGSDGQLLLGWAKRLRNSGFEYVRNNVFFSAQLTRAERQAAYEARCRRREKTTARQQDTDTGRAVRNHPPNAATADNQQTNQPQSSVVIKPSGRLIATTTVSALTTVINTPAAGLPACHSFVNGSVVQAPTITTPAVADVATADHSTAARCCLPSSAAAGVAAPRNVNIAASECEDVEQETAVDLTSSQLHHAAAEFIPAALSACPLAPAAAGGDGGNIHGHSQ